MYLLEWIFGNEVEIALSTIITAIFGIILLLATLFLIAHSICELIYGLTGIKYNKLSSIARKNRRDRLTIHIYTIIITILVSGLMFMLSYILYYKI